MPVPAGVHYDQWLGSAPVDEFTKNRFHYTWHWFWDYCNGDFGNQGIHELDIARWGLGVSYPYKISAMGGHYNDPAKRNAPIEEGAKSATLMHLGNISYRLGRMLTFDAEKLECVGDHDATAMFRRKYRSPYVVPEKGLNHRKLVGPLIVLALAR